MGNFAEPHSWSISVEKLDALAFKRFPHFFTRRSEASDGLGTMCFHVPNSIVANPDQFSQSLLIKSEQRSGRSQLIA
jgi:hypothetical protein